MDLPRKRAQSYSLTRNGKWPTSEKLKPERQLIGEKSPISRVLKGDLAVTMGYVLSVDWHGTSQIGRYTH